MKVAHENKEKASRKTVFHLDETQQCTQNVMRKRRFQKKTRFGLDETTQKQYTGFRDPGI
jgi:hypothetical protein